MSPRNGGVYEAVLVQAEMLREMGAVAVLVGIGDAPPLCDAEINLPKGIGPEAFAYAPALSKVLASAELDLLHLHGIWQYPSVAAASWARATNRPLLISPHGMLDPWITRRGRWKKVVARALWERRSWSLANFHALTPDEAVDIASEAHSNSIVIPNAAPVVEAASAAERSPNLLYLGRFHSKKNLPALIEAWRLAQPSLPAEARLQIAGWGSAEETAAVQRMAAAAPSCQFLGPLHGEAKAAALRAAKFLILPSLSEGLPMVVLEAWAHGTPALISRACHLPQGFAAGAAVDCGTGPAEIAAAIRSAFALPENGWSAMSGCAQRLARGTFGRPAVQRHWEQLYGALLEPLA